MTIDPQIFFHVYVSSAVAPFSTTELLKLMSSSRQKNLSRGITGILLHQDGNFMQIVEGPELAVRNLLDIIYHDTRHRGLIKMLEGRTETRQFPDWSMGFRELNAPEIRELPGFNEFLNSPINDDTFKNNPTKCQRLLNIFKKSHR